MYFRFNLLVYRFAKKNVEKTNSQTNKKKVNGIVLNKYQIRYLLDMTFNLVALLDENLNDLKLQTSNGKC
jgi:hypothetical protein